MGIFDFLKPEKPHDEGLPDSPAIRSATMGMAVDQVQKQIANLCAVGREQDVDKIVKDFMILYERETGGGACGSEELAKICYRASYKDLPELVFDRWAEFEELWASKFPFSAYLGIKNAAAILKSMSLSQIQEFKHMTGSIGDNIKCYFIKYPTPRPLDEAAFQASVQAIRAGRKDIPVYTLGVYFAVVSQSKKTNERWLHVLGQSPTTGKTTIRMIDAPGCSANHGSGPDPSSPEDFLRAIKKLIEKN